MGQVKYKTYLRRRFQPVGKQQEFLSGDTLLFVIFNELRIFAKTGKSVIRI